MPLQKEHCIMMAISGEEPPPYHGREKACFRVYSINVNTLSALEKRRKLIEIFGEEGWILCGHKKSIQKDVK